MFPVALVNLSRVFSYYYHMFILYLFSLFIIIVKTQKVALPKAPFNQSHFSKHKDIKDKTIVYLALNKKIYNR